MRGRKYPFGFAILLIVFCMSMVSVKAQSKNRLGGRDLQTYERGPIYDRLVDFHHKDARILESAQQYLWNAWSEKRKTYFELIEYTREGDRVRNKFFVETDKSGVWHIGMDATVYSCRTYALPKNCGNRILPAKTFDSVQWGVKTFLRGKVRVKTEIPTLTLINSKTKAEYILERSGLF